MWKAVSARVAAVKHKRLDWRRVKIHRNYDAADIFRDFGVSRNAVWNWRKSGLRPIEGIWPMLFLGAELRRFLAERRAKPRRTTPAGHIMCMRCREPRRPAGDMVDYLPGNATSGNLKAMCTDCGAWMHRRVRLRDLERVMPGIDVKVRPADGRLRQTPRSSVNHDSDTPCGPHAKTPP
jgi:hypothetical protein